MWVLTNCTNKCQPHKIHVKHTNQVALRLAQADERVLTHVFYYTGHIWTRTAAVEYECVPFISYLQTNEVKKRQAVEILSFVTFNQFRIRLFWIANTQKLFIFFFEWGLFFSYFLNSFGFIANNGGFRCNICPQLVRTLLIPTHHTCTKKKHTPKQYACEL